MLTAIFLLALAAPPDVPPARVVQVLDFAAIASAGLDAWDGRRATLLVERDSRAEEFGGWLLLDARGPRRDNGLHRTCWLHAGQTKGEVMIVTGRMRVIRHAAREGFAAFTEVRLESGVVERVVKPWEGD